MVRSQVIIFYYATPNSLYRQLKLDAEVAAAIEAEVQQPYLEYQRKLEEYESTLVETRNAESTLSEPTLNDLRDYQQHLGLRDEYVATIEERVIGERKIAYEVDPSEYAPSPQFWGSKRARSYANLMEYVPLPILRE